MLPSVYKRPVSKSVTTKVRCGTAVIAEILVFYINGIGGRWFYDCLGIVARNTDSVTTVPSLEHRNRR